MVDLYVALIIAGRRKYSSVPEKLKADVLANLDVLGLDQDGKPKQDTVS